MAKRSAKKKEDAGPKPAFSMSPANEDIFAWGGQLSHVRVPKVDTFDNEEIGGRCVHAFEPTLAPGAQDSFFEPYRFEAMCHADAAVQGALRQLRKKQYSEASLKALHTQIQRVFDDEYLPDIITRFDTVSQLVTQYFAAREAWKALHPEDFQEGKHEAVVDNGAQHVEQPGKDS
jgi:hypothetical protein